MLLLKLHATFLYLFHAHFMHLAQSSYQLAIQRNCWNYDDILNKDLLMRPIIFALYSKTATHWDRWKWYPYGTLLELFPFNAFEWSSQANCWKLFCRVETSPLSLCDLWIRTLLVQNGLMNSFSHLNPSCCKKDGAMVQYLGNIVLQ